jgi:uncharacterized protein Yka (UPF0111/DUF47 family)
MSLVQHFIKRLLPAEPRFYDHLDAAALAAVQAAQLFSQLTRAATREEQHALVEQIREAEHAGDRAKKDMTDGLDRTFVTPLDREDLYLLVDRLENVSDFIAATANHLTVHQMATLPVGSDELGDILVRATLQFQAGVRELRDLRNADRIRAITASLRYLEHEADVIFRLRLGDLFRHETDAIELIKSKEFLEGLEDAVDRCNAVGTTLEAILIKNG